MILNIVKLNNELNTVRAEKQDISKKMEASQASFDTMKAELDKMTLANKELTDKLEGFKKEEAAIVIATNESVNEKVIQKVATLGIAEGTIKNEVVTTPVASEQTDVYKTYESLKGKEKIDFYKKNQKGILLGMNQYHKANYSVKNKTN